MSPHCSAAPWALTSSESDDPDPAPGHRRPPPATVVAVCGWPMPATLRSLVVAVSWQLRDRWMGSHRRFPACVPCVRGLLASGGGDRHGSYGSGGRVVAVGSRLAGPPGPRGLWKPARNRDLFVTQSPVEQGVLGLSVSVGGA